MKTLVMLLVLAGGALGQVPGMTDEAAQQEALVQQIRENLALIDQLLLDASEADDVGAGLSDVRKKQVDVVTDLEELIKQIKYQRSSSSSSSGQSDSPPQDQNQPPPRQSDGQQQQDQQGQQPQSPQEQQQGDQQQEGQEQQQQGQERPQGGQPDNQQPTQQDGGPPPPDPLGDFTREDTDDRWGLLPPKLQERLLNLQVDEVPERYRQWLEAYSRSVHQLESSEGP